MPIKTQNISKWISNKTLYFIKNQKVYKYKEHIQIIESINIDRSLIKIVNYSIKSKEVYYKSHVLQKSSKQYIKISNNINYLYNLNFIKDNYIHYKYKEKSSAYDEYIYSINNNLKISIAILKKTKQYYAVVFTSYIKQIK